MSYSGYYATKKSPETMSRNTSLSESYVTSTADDNEKKQKQEEIESKAGMGSTEDTIVIKESPSDQQIYKDVENKKKVETNITPTPSPRIKKRLRREQFLQKHKQMGKEVHALAKTCTAKDMSASRVILVPNIM